MFSIASKERDLFRYDITGNQNVLENRRQQYQKIKDNLREKGYRLGGEDEPFLVATGKNKKNK